MSRKGWSAKVLMWMAPVQPIDHRVRTLSTTQVLPLGISMPVASMCNYRPVSGYGWNIFIRAEDFDDSILQQRTLVRDCCRTMIIQRHTQECTVHTNSETTP